jgi:polysaccharide biosynthesis/export protein
MRNFIIIIVLLSLILTSCVTTHDTSYLQSPKQSFSSVPSYKDTISYQDYRIRVGDKLNIQVYSTDDKTNSLFNSSLQGGMSIAASSSNDNIDLYIYIVDNNGSIHLPLVGDVKVLGKTVRESKYILEESIKPVLPLNSVDVRLIGRYFSVIGSGKSGRFPMLKEKVNVFQALAMFGDFGFYVDRKKIRIIRQTESGTIIKKFDIRSADIIHSEYYYIEPNDVIYVEPLTAQFFGVTTFWSAIGTVMTTFTFGVFLYKSIL